AASGVEYAYSPPVVGRENFVEPAADAECAPKASANTPATAKARRRATTDMRSEMSAPRAAEASLEGVTPVWPRPPAAPAPAPPRPRERANRARAGRRAESTPAGRPRRGRTAEPAPASRSD